VERVKSCVFSVQSARISQPNQASDGCRRDQCRPRRLASVQASIHSHHNPLHPSQSLHNTAVTSTTTASSLVGVHCFERYRASDLNFFIFAYYQKATSRDLRTSQGNLTLLNIVWLATIKKTWHYWRNQVKKRHHQFKTSTKINPPLDQGKHLLQCINRFPPTLITDSSKILDRRS
jgi:hypothetical protein